jgi:hypothetical protein
MDIDRLACHKNELPADCALIIVGHALSSRKLVVVEPSSSCLFAPIFDLA